MEYLECDECDRAFFGKEALKHNKKHGYNHQKINDYGLTSDDLAAIREAEKELTECL